MKQPVPTTRGEAAARWLEDKGPLLKQALASLVEVYSFTENTAGGSKVGQLLCQQWKLPGLVAEVVPSNRFANHLVFRSEGDARLPPVALLGHLDTVFPPGKFEGYRVEGALRRGPAGRPTSHPSCLRWLWGGPRL